jgi:DNA invertase Pin-like site-specific DNA recombinase
LYCAIHFYRGFAFSKSILDCLHSNSTNITSFENLMLIGYARVSTDEQNLDLQRDALNRAGCERLFEDKASGAKVAREGLSEALSHLRAGDTLAVWKLDRLGRSVKGLVDLVEDLAKRGIGFKSITDSIDTSTPAGRFFFHVMASLAQMERELIIERTRAGLIAAKSKGRVGGRKRSMTVAKVDAAKKLLASGSAPRDVADSLGVSVPTLYRWIPAGARSAVL